MKTVRYSRKLRLQTGLVTRIIVRLAWDSFITVSFITEISIRKSCWLICGGNNIDFESFFSNVSTTVEPRLTTTPLIRPPRYYGHFILAQKKKLSQSFSYLKNPFNTTTSLMTPFFHGPKVVALTGFHCM